MAQKYRFSQAGITAPHTNRKLDGYDQWKARSTGFLSHLFIKVHLFTKTGSGQT